MNTANHPASGSSLIGWKGSSSATKPDSTHSSKKKIVAIKGHTVSIKSKPGSQKDNSIINLETESQTTLSIDALPAVPSRLQYQRSSELGDGPSKFPSQDAPSLSGTDLLTLDDVASGKYVDFLEGGTQTRLTKGISNAPTSLNELIQKPSCLENASLQSINENPELREENQEERSPLRLTVKIYQDLEETKTNKMTKGSPYPKSAKSAKSGKSVLAQDRIVNDNEEDIDNLEISRENHDNNNNNVVDLEANIAQGILQTEPEGERQGNSQEQNNEPDAQNTNQQAGEQNPNNATENQNNTEGQANNNTTGVRTQFVWITGPVPAEFLRYAKPETKIYLNKVIGIFLAIILASVLSFFQLYEFYFAVASALIGYIIIFDVTVKSSALNDLYMKGDDVYLTFDGFAAAFSIVLLYIRTTDMLPICTFAALPFVLFTCFYLYGSKAPRRKKAFMALLKCFYIAQITLVALKLDQNIDWDWKLVLCPAWVFLAGAVINCIYHIQDLYKKVTKPMYPQFPMSKTTKTVGCVWHLLYYAQIIPAILGTVGLTNVILPRRDGTLLNVAAAMTLILAVPALILIFFHKQRLVRFIIIGGFIDSILARYKASKPKKLVKTIDLEVEATETYFVMLSSTYFQPLQKSFLTKGKESLEKIKKMLGELKFGKWKLVSSNSAQDKDTAIDIESLKQAKQNFDRTLSRPATIKTPPAVKIPGRKFLQINNNNGVVHTAGLRENTIEDGIDELRMKYTLSSQNPNVINKFYPLEAMSPKIGDDEKLCHLCYVNAPDAVLMNCGHGGICHECAVTIVKKKDECLECRGKVEAIYKIDPNPKLSNIVKATEISKVVVKMV